MRRVALVPFFDPVWCLEATVAVGRSSLRWTLSLVQMFPVTVILTTLEDRLEDWTDGDKDV
jgi:hypothetical protein